ncbi:MAG: ThiF family adenylyltransferase, partial [Bacteroidaceae bacterium]|nr:ThiF family adenylyltransferase [Bacteroidaceae bacterium]
MFQFTDEEKERYARHIILKGIGAEGQEKICKGKVLVVGSGGLGSPVLMYLAAAGVGTLGVVDGDVVDLSNLQRQIIHSTDNIGKSKVESARERILTVNP